MAVGLATALGCGEIRWGWLESRSSGLALWEVEVAHEFMVHFQRIKGKRWGVRERGKRNTKNKLK
jgi:hypothetical protein